MDLLNILKFDNLFRGMKFGYKSKISVQYFYKLLKLGPKNTGTCGVNITVM